MIAKISPIIFSETPDPEVEISKEELMSIEDLVDTLEVPVFLENPFQGTYPCNFNTLVYVNEKCWLYVLNGVVLINGEDAYEDTVGLSEFLHSLAKKRLPEYAHLMNRQLFSETSV